MQTSPKILDKIKCMVNDYYPLAYVPVGEVDMQYFETLDHLRNPPKDADWKKAVRGTSWGGHWKTAWFSGTYEPAQELNGQALFLRANTGGHESLCWVNDEPRAILTAFSAAELSKTGHTELLLTPKADGSSLAISIEAYAWHPCIGTFPRHNRTGSNTHTFNFVDVTTRRDDVWGLIIDLRVLISLMDSLDENSLRRNRIVKGLADVFAVLPQLPVELPEDIWRPAVAEARKLLAPLLAARNGDSAPYIGLTGHSHMDTAWLWPVAETERKCARTYANALTLMEEYDEYRFIQSSSCHGDMMRRLYPKIFERIQAMVKAGRWEPNGGSWVEPDCNVIGAEALVRQFLIGQTATREMFDYTSDTFWMPDTFGYSAALPQILQSCNIPYFCTTKLDWNDTNRFPYDSFVWRGIDGTGVLAHFNKSHCWPDPKTLTDMWIGVQHKDVQDRRLCSYGFGDGGGGPLRGMIEVTRRIEDLEGCPRTAHTTVSDFMAGLEKECPDLPVWFGELYLELHRGTLTSIHGVKRGNRKGEVALQVAEALCVRAALNGATYPAAELEELWKKLLLNQFHDILPGSSIPEVNDQAIAEFAEVRSDAAKLIETATASDGDASGAVELHNTLSWDRTRAVVDWTSEAIPAAEGATCQLIEDIEGNRKLAIDGVTIPALGSTVVAIGEDGESAAASSPFRVTDDAVHTPSADIQFDEAGGITSFVFGGRELVRDPNSPLNSLYIGQDVPKGWDNWDIDEDQKIKMHRETRLVSREVVADGPLQLRIRMTYELGTGSKLTQDVVFHAKSAQIDFETIVEWNELHAFLKAGFDVDVFADRARHEIQFGHAFRNTHTNLTTDRARFESSNHRWSDLSEPGFGAAVLNDCKYGISIDGSDMRLSLLKSGTHPDPRGDAGTHVFTYSFLPHDCGFSAEAVIRPGYELNVPVVVSAPSGAAGSTTGLVSLDDPAVIVESVKLAEDGAGFIARMYEAEGSRAATKVRFGVSVEAQETNMLEETSADIEITDGACELKFRPFEIKTIRCRPKGN
jgi:alpha-mannosidase